MLPESQVADAALLQDTASERLLPAVQIALDAAATVPGVTAAMPPNLLPMVELALFSALVAVAALSHGASTVGTERIPNEQLHTMAAEMAPKVADDVWQTSQQIVLTAREIASRVPSPLAPQPLPAPTGSSPYAAQARLLARTVATRVAAEASVAVGQQLGLGYKVWISRGDAKVREEHRKLHGRAVPIGSPFTKWPDGQRLDYPGDPSAPMDSWINCRCILFLAPTRTAVADALQPANLDSAFALAASLEQEWFHGTGIDGLTYSPTA